ncbi:bifunctional methylenetetrahydrofolate dehydrogenase/cyclohydrolase, mitochondrial isoform X3 [Belonocnema kinseyi]|uniref:bifunctional methylenetetrahydrofolate dehydrogenase/cyclohydrolase, mitochondrial isoform X3 n=1 Tax=Belonocnema kinseyi TaxID=2817044 RepID=UPI00143CDDA6|nr:bifunctional methylenetetrahydrofolate dehydrogenase/cyclohydrolase, mitochondrial isoform X3 [Belonocnema kinseyi]
MSILKFSVKLTREYHTPSAQLEAAIIDGNNIAKQIEKEVRTSVESWIKSGKRRPKLVAIIVGDDPASKVYVSRKVKVAKAVGIDAETITFDKSISQKHLLKAIENLNKDTSVDGILVQLPIPKSINEREICEAVTPAKDVDGFHSENMGKLSVDNDSIVPATALGVIELIQRTKVDTFGKNAVVIGRSKHVGLPIALLLHSDSKGVSGALDMTTTICHRHTPPEELKKFTRLADVVVAAAGVPGLVKKDMVKPGACVIDVGITRVDTESGQKLLGDVDYESVKEIAGHITPVPGGVGPMTVVMLMKNTLKAARKNQS